MADVALGSFNPNFYGVSLVHGDPDNFRHLQAYGEADDLGAWIENATRLDIKGVGRLSVIDHEVRHFHDFLASPFGLNTMGLRIQASINGIQAILAIAEAPGKYLPIPLSRWMNWDPGQRQAWIDRTGRPFGYDNLADFVTLPGPEHSDVPRPEGFASLADVPLETSIGLWAGATVGAFRRMMEMREALPPRNGYPPISPSDAFEGSAHLVQAQAVWQGQGAAASAAYMTFLETADLAVLRPYNALRLALQEAPVQVSGQRMAELYMWTLLGPPEDPHRFGNPAVRLLLLLALAGKSPHGLLLNTKVETLWTALDQLTGSPPWGENLAAADVVAARRREKYRTLRGRFPPAAYVEAFFDVCELWLDDRQLMSDLLKSDPVIYAAPGNYVSQPLGTFPTPFLHISFGRYLHRRTKPLPAKARLKIIAADAAGRDVIAYVGVLGDRAAWLDKVIDASSVSATVDYCFFDEAGASAVDSYLEASLVELSRKELVHIY